MNREFSPARVLVTGASGGLGSALAQHYARPGARLSLWGRDEAKLAIVAGNCRSRGAEIEVRSLDLTDVHAALAALLDEDATDPFDLALFSSGRGDIRAADDRVESATLVAHLGAINFAAPAAMAAALGARMAERGRGHIVLVGSAAAFHALPFAAAYSGTKAGLARFCDALRLSLKSYGVRITLVSPGFIDTRAGREVPGPKPLMMKPDVVAGRIAWATARGRAHLILPWPFAVLRWIDRLLPAFLRDRILLGLAPQDDHRRDRSNTSRPPNITK